MVECGIHGLSFGAECCRHIQEAVLETRAREPVFVVIDGLGDPNYLCAACYARATAWLDGYATGSVSAEPEFCDTGTCAECLREWYVETGQGDRSLAVTAARAARRAIEARRAASSSP